MQVVTYKRQASEAAAAAEGSRQKQGIVAQHGAQRLWLCPWLWLWLWPWLWLWRWLDAAERDCSSATKWCAHPGRGRAPAASMTTHLRY